MKTKLTVLLTALVLAGVTNTFAGPRSSQYGSIENVDMVRLVVMK